MDLYVGCVFSCLIVFQVSFPRCRAQRPVRQDPARPLHPPRQSELAGQVSDKVFAAQGPERAHHHRGRARAPLAPRQPQGARRAPAPLPRAEHRPRRANLGGGRGHLGIQ